MTKEWCTYEACILWVKSFVVTLVLGLGALVSRAFSLGTNEAHLSLVDSGVAVGLHQLDTLVLNVLLHHTLCLGVLQSFLHVLWVVLICHQVGHHFV